MDSEIVGMSDITDDAISFTWIVDNAIRSRTPSNLGLVASPVHSFVSVVDSAIRSRTPSNLGSGASPVHSFVSVVDSAIRSRTPSNLGFGASLIHSFASLVDVRTISARSSQVEGLQLFTLAELVAATNNFSLDNKIGTGSFGVVYKGELVDGHEVAVNRGWSKRLSLFKSEFAFFSRLRHKHLVGLVGLCEEKDERLLVYEYMKNGALYDRLHDKGSSVLSSWKMRINIALDASRGIEHLHSHAVPPYIIHRDIKSSNILLDDTWTASARLYGFGLSLMSPEPDHDYRPMKTAGTVGFIDPRYYGLNELTAKRDVHGFGVVLLELLTGRTRIFKSGEDGGTSLSVVDFAVPPILAGDLLKILDPRVGPPDVNEAVAVQLVAYTAIRCVNLEGKYRPTMSDIVVNLERAFCYLL